MLWTGIAKAHLWLKTRFKRTRAATKPRNGAGDTCASTTRSDYEEITRRTRRAVLRARRRYDEDQDSAAYRACVDFVVEHAAPESDDVVLDLGTGTGAIAFALAPDAGEIIGRDISDGMLEKAREKADERGAENVSFGDGRFRAPNVDRPVDIVTSNFAMHHLADDEKRDAIDTIADLGRDESSSET